MYVLLCIAMHMMSFNVWSLPTSPRRLSASCDCTCRGDDYVPDEREPPHGGDDCWILDVGYDKPCCVSSGGTDGSTLLTSTDGSTLLTSVSCGGHIAPSCSQCFPQNAAGESSCNGECEWRNNACWPDGSEDMPFDPTSPLVSYVDESSCGPRGDDAVVDGSGCAEGVVEVTQVPIDGYKVRATFKGCDYFSYTVYKCAEAPTPATPDKPKGGGTSVSKEGNADYDEEGSPALWDYGPAGFEFWMLGVNISSCEVAKGDDLTKVTIVAENAGYRHGMEWVDRAGCGEKDSWCPEMSSSTADVNSWTVKWRTKIPNMTFTVALITRDGTTHAIGKPKTLTYAWFESHPGFELTSIAMPPGPDGCTVSLMVTPNDFHARVNKDYMTFSLVTGSIVVLVVLCVTNCCCKKGACACIFDPWEKLNEKQAETLFELCSSMQSEPSWVDYMPLVGSACRRRANRNYQAAQKDKKKKDKAEPDNAAAEADEAEQAIKDEIETKLKQLDQLGETTSSPLPQPPGMWEQIRTFLQFVAPSIMCAVGPFMGRTDLIVTSILPPYLFGFGCVQIVKVLLFRRSIHRQYKITSASAPSSRVHPQDAHKATVEMSTVGDNIMFMQAFIKAEIEAEAELNKSVALAVLRFAYMVFFIALNIPVWMLLTSMKDLKVIGFVPAFMIILFSFTSILIDRLMSERVRVSGKKLAELSVKRATRVSLEASERAAYVFKQLKKITEELTTSEVLMLKALLLGKTDAAEAEYKKMQALSNQVSGEPINDIPNLMGNLNKNVTDKYSHFRSRFDRLKHAEKNLVVFKPPPSGHDNSGLRNREKLLQPKSSDESAAKKTETVVKQISKFVDDARRLEEGFRRTIKGLCDKINEEGRFAFPSRARGMMSPARSGIVTGDTGVPLQAFFGPAKDPFRAKAKLDKIRDNANKEDVDEKTKKKKKDAYGNEEKFKGPWGIISNPFVEDDITPGLLFDFMRCTVIADDPGALYCFLLELEREKKIKIRTLVNKFDLPAVFVNNVQLLIEFESHVCEVQITLTDFKEIAFNEHIFYEYRRSSEPEEHINGVAYKHPGFVTCNFSQDKVVSSEEAKSWRLPLVRKDFKAKERAVMMCDTEAEAETAFTVLKKACKAFAVELRGKITDHAPSPAVVAMQAEAEGTEAACVEEKSESDEQETKRIAHALCAARLYEATFRVLLMEMVEGVAGCSGKIVFWGQPATAELRGQKNPDYMQAQVVFNQQLALVSFFETMRAHESMGVLRVHNGFAQGTQDGFGKVVVHVEVSGEIKFKAKVELHLKDLFEVATFLSSVSRVEKMASASELGMGVFLTHPGKDIHPAQARGAGEDFSPYKKEMEALVEKYHLGLTA